MASCAACNATIFFGGNRTGDLRFCNASCQRNGNLAIAASQLDADTVSQHLEKLHRGNCPKCGGEGPVDVHTSYRIWSALVLTQYSARPSICCKSCGTKQRIGDTVYSAVLGWWGFPWGILVTPIWIGRNVVGFFSNPDPEQPSPALEKGVRLHLASNVPQALPQARGGR